MSTADENIKQWKSLPQREVMLKICNSINESNDLIGQIMRTHLWAQGFMDGILYQISKYSEKDSFAVKNRHLLELGLIDQTHNQELKILNDIRNLIAHNLYPNEKIIEEVKKFPRYDQFKTPQKLEVFGLDVSDMGTFGIISFMLMHYLMKVFWNPEIKN